MQNRGILFFTSVLIAFSSVNFAHAQQEPLNAVTWEESTQKGPTALTDAPQLSQFQADMPKARLDALGLIPQSVSGLSQDIWQKSQSDALIARLNDLRAPKYASARSFLYLLLLAETVPPIASEDDTGADGQFLAARIALLRRLGAVEAAYAMLENLQPWPAALYPQGFDLALLLGKQSKHCPALLARHDINETLSAKIYCAAQTGQWVRADLALSIASELQSIGERDQRALFAFLHAEDLEADALVIEPNTALEAVIMRALGRDIDPRQHEDAFAVLVLDGDAGWRNALFAAERLARNDAIADNLFLGLYTEQKPSASGGIWDRVRAFQRFDAAYQAGDESTVFKELPEVWKLMQAQELGGIFARIYASALIAMRDEQPLDEILWTMGLMSDPRQVLDRDIEDAQINIAFIRALLGGKKLEEFAQSALEKNIATGLGAYDLSTQDQELVENSQSGQAALHALLALQAGEDGNAGELARGLALLRQAGFARVAARIAIEILLASRARS